MAAWASAGRSSGRHHDHHRDRQETTRSGRICSSPAPLGRRNSVRFRRLRQCRTRSLPSQVTDPPAKGFLEACATLRNRNPTESLTHSGLISKDGTSPWRTRRGDPVSHSAKPLCYLLWSSRPAGIRAKRAISHRNGLASLRTLHHRGSAARPQSCRVRGSGCGGESDQTA
jgi:hypothetical protein